LKQVELIEEEIIWDDLNLNYTGENNYASFLPSKSNLHSYPAKAVPEMVSVLLRKVKNEYEIKSVLDPFVGSGTTALETKYLGIDFYGSDLNPLAILISRTKVINLSSSNNFITSIKLFLDKLSGEYQETKDIKLTKFKNIEYWFKESNIVELSYIKESISDFLQQKDKKNIENYALILFSAFSTTVRTSSLSRNSEFKLYRMSPSNINKFKINSINVYIENVTRILDMLIQTNNIYENETKVQIELENAKSLKFLNRKKVDFILTSPPYGDSRSTVAYGQFSRLSLQWMSDLINKYLNINVYSHNCDEYLLGGKKSDFEINEKLMIKSSNTLKDLIVEMDIVIEEEISKLIEMRQSLLNIKDLIKNNEIIRKQDFNDNLFILIKERIRLDYFRKINKEGNYSSKEVKIISVEKTEHYLQSLFIENKKDSVEMLEKFVISVMESIKRKIISVPKRKREVLDFFNDLFQVVAKTDEVLNHGGIQAWIVGHRTILGKININMKEILSDWFSNMGYEKVTDLTREYSFKRLPHHINSTVSRNAQIQTMMQEHILIVRKGS
jgi:16S rRNA G966 N2-methylase RsmD